MVAETTLHQATAVRLLALQVSVIVSVLVLTRLRTTAPHAALGLGGGRPGWHTIVRAFVRMLLVIVPFSVLVWLIAPELVWADLRFFVEALRSPAAWMFLISVGIGAPLSEELLFRGLLLPSLAASRLGFAGAAVVTSALWTALHWGYSIVGLVEIFAIGLYFAWLRESTGSLWTPLLCHMAYNLALATVLIVLPLAV